MENLSLDLLGRSQLFLGIINNAIILNTLQQEYPLEQGMGEIAQLLMACRENKGMAYVVGNGGSAAIAGHAVIDLLNMAKLRAITLHESATITCLSNDYGYEKVYEQQLRCMVRESDVLIAISSSGKSKNILNAVHAAKENHAKVVTLSGFSADNPLRKSGDINLWLNSNDYGLVEIGHAFILHNITDRLRIA